MSYRSRSRKRYSTRSMSRRPVSRRRRATRRLPRAVRGYVRTGGNYGRYQGSGGVELKYFDQAQYFDPNTPSGQLAFVPATGGSVVAVLDDGNSGIAQGTGVSQRIGNKIVLKSIFVTGCSNMNNLEANVSSGMMRWWLILDSQCNGAAPLFTDVFSYTQPLASALGDAIATGVVNPVRNLANSKRFRILKEGTQLHCATSEDSSTGTNFVPMKTFKTYMKCNIPIEYGAVGTAEPKLGRTASIRSNALYLLMQNFVGYVDCSFIIRTRYSDL